MVADITNKDGQDLVAVNWERGHPWHMLGKRTRKDMGIEEGLELVGVKNEIVEPRTLFAQVDNGLELQYEEIEGKVAIYSSVFGPISVASPSYEITQRREILELAYEITGLSGEDAHIDTIGNLGLKGETFFAYIQVPDLVIDPNGIADVIERGLFVGTSFDGSLPNTIGYSNIRVVCSNTLQMALPGLQQAIRIKHTRNSEDRMRIAAEGLEYVGAVEKKVVEKAEQMLGVKDGEKALGRVLDHFFSLDGQLSDTVKTKRAVVRGEVRQMYEGKDNLSSELVGKNGYGAYQAFTDYIDHARGVRSRGRSEMRVRAESAVLPGKYADMKIRASELVLN